MPLLDLICCNVHQAFCLIFKNTDSSSIAAHDRTTLDLRNQPSDSFLSASLARSLFLQYGNQNCAQYSKCGTNNMMYHFNHNLQPPSNRDKCAPTFLITCFMAMLTICDVVLFYIEFHLPCFCPVINLYSVTVLKYPYRSMSSKLYLCPNLNTLHL